MEQAKMELSSLQRTKLRLPDLFPGNSIELELTRETLERRIEPDLERSLRSVRDAIQQAEERGLQQEQLDGVLLVGGSTKIPAVKRKLVDYFERGDGFVKADLNPAAVVARGAAMVAARLKPTDPPFDIGRAPEVMKVDGDGDEAPVQVRPIAEHSLGVALEDGTCRRLIERGTPIPASSTQRNFTNSAPGPLVVAIYQGNGRSGATTSGSVTFGCSASTRAGPVITTTSTSPMSWTKTACCRSGPSTTTSPGSTGRPRSPTTRGCATRTPFG